MNCKFPQNFIIQKPLAGSFIIAIAGFLFIVLYKPLGVKASRDMSFELTMAVYSSFSGLSAFLAIKIIKSVKWFRNEDGWTIIKELLSAILVISATCLSVYFLGFVVEESSPRWNLSTFYDSFINAFLIGVIPFTFFTLGNYRYLFPHKIKSFAIHVNNEGEQTTGEMLRISSQLKKESLSFYPSELIYAESDGNYVVFYLEKESQVKKQTIRNSINNIEQQFAGYPFLFRTHRAFIVNLKKVISKHGTTLGYNLKLSGTEESIPVSRNNTKEFNRVLSELTR
jgi:hypothetical protein